MHSGDGTTDTVTIALWGANLLTSGSGTATAGNWFDVFWAPTTITPGITYYLVLTSANNTLAIDGSASDKYPNGQSFANGFLPYPYDFTFRTYYDNAVNSVPEPASLGLFGIGAAGILALVLLRRCQQRVS